MKSKFLVICLLILVGLTQIGQAQTTRKAKVQVKNSTGTTIYNVTVVHKYSDVHKEKMVWKGELKPGASTPANFTVRFNTGVGTTGKDWWIVSWSESRDANSIVQYTTAPNNFRDIIDLAEKGAKVGIPIATTVLGVASVAAGPVAGLAIAGGSIIANELADKTMNTSKTSGFKQHILRKKDAKKTTVINITKKRKVAFKSPSGKSTTPTKSQVFKFNKN